MTSQLKVLPSSWVERIFARLTGVYGREFTGQFSSGMVDGVDVGLENAKQVWAEELGMFADHPDALRYGLANLPEKVPNCIRFREVCKNAPRPQYFKLEHKPTPEERAASRERIREIMAKLRVNGNGQEAQH